MVSGIKFLKYVRLYLERCRKLLVGGVSNKSLVTFSNLKCLMVFWAQIHSLCKCAFPHFLQLLVCFSGAELATAPVTSNLRGSRLSVWQLKHYKEKNAVMLMLRLHKISGQQTDNTLWVSLRESQDSKTKHARWYVAILMLYCLQRME